MCTLDGTWGRALLRRSLARDLLFRAHLTTGGDQYFFAGATERSFGSSSLWLLVILCFLSRSAAFAQYSPLSPQELVRQAVGNELASPFFTQSCTYEYRREVSGAWETRFMVKSPQLVVGKLVRINNTPLSPQQEQQEEQHLQTLLEDPRKQEQERKQQQKFEQQVRALVAALPDAFHYTQTQVETGVRGQRLVRLTFQPAADFKPATATAELLRAMHGSVIIDERTRQVVRFDAQLYRDADFGWGMLVRVRKGGNFLLARDPSNPSFANVKKLALNANGRILLFKNFELHWEFDHFSCFDQNLSLRSAVAILTESRFAQIWAP